MPRWICPYCTHLSTFAAIAVGHNFACPACKVESKVVDADAEAIGRLRNEKAAGEATAFSLRSVTISTIVLGLMLVLGMLGSIVLIVKGPVWTGVNSLVTIIICACVMSPLFDAINEIHRCRKLLEELVKKK